MHGDTMYRVIGPPCMTTKGDVPRVVRSGGCFNRGGCSVHVGAQCIVGLVVDGDDS